MSRKKYRKLSFLTCGQTHFLASILMEVSRAASWGISIPSNEAVLVKHEFSLRIAQKLAKDLRKIRERLRQAEHAPGLASHGRRWPDSGLLRSFLLQMCFRESLRWCSRNEFGLSVKRSFWDESTLDNTTIPRLSCFLHCLSCRPARKTCECNMSSETKLLGSLA